MAMIRRAVALRRAAALGRAVALSYYVEQLMKDQEVQAHVRQALGEVRDVRKSARGKSPTEAIEDRKVQRHAAKAADAARRAWIAVEKHPPKRPSRRRRRLVALGLLLAGTVLACNAELRAKARVLLSGSHEGR